MGNPFSRNVIKTISIFKKDKIWIVKKGVVKRVVFSIHKDERDKFEHLNRTDKYFVYTLDKMAFEMAKKQTTDFMQHPFFMSIPKKKGHLSIHGKGMKQWQDYSEGRVGYR